MRSARPVRRRRWACWACWAATLLSLSLASCRATPSSNLRALADDAPTPCSVLVTGGAFVSRLVGEQSVLDRTFAQSDGVTRADGQDADTFGAGTFDADSFDDRQRAALEASEGVALSAVVGALRAARSFVRVEADDRDAVVRQAFASYRGALPASEPEVREFLAQAARDGHDYLLFLDTIADGPVQQYGINSRWPITAVAWLALGIGMVIPDHTFESTAELRVSMRDVHSGEVVYQRVFDGDPIDLALIDRSDFWGLVTSILVPPFWVGNDDERVQEQVREATTRRLLFLLAQDLKSTACQNRLRARAPAEIRVVADADGLLNLRVRALEGVSLLRLQVDGKRYSGPAWEEFSRRFLDRVQVEADGAAVYEGVFREPIRGRFVRLLAQTVGGRVASTTIDLERLSSLPEGN